MDAVVDEAAEALLEALHLRGRHDRAGVEQIELEAARAVDAVASADAPPHALAERAQGDVVALAPHVRTVDEVGALEEPADLLVGDLADADARRVLAAVPIIII